MSIKLSIKYPNGGPVHTVEAPLSRNASTRPGVTGEAVHQMMMIHDYTVNTINNVFDSQLERPQDQYRERGYYEEDRRNYGHLRYEHRARIVQYPPQGYEINRRHRDSRSRSPVRSDSHHRHAFDHVDWPTMQGIVRRVHDSCYVQRAVGHEHLTHPDDLMVGVGPVRKVTHKFIIKKFTPLRRVLNAYTGWEHKDPKFWELQWQGRRLGWGEGDTADKVKYLALLTSHSVGLIGLRDLLLTSF